MDLEPFKFFQEALILATSELLKSKLQTGSLAPTLISSLGTLQQDPDRFLISLALLFSRIGYETGFFKRLLDENRISWGYYVDHNLFEPHCNAHPNNFLVLDIEAAD